MELFLIIHDSQYCQFIAHTVYSITHIQCCFSLTQAMVWMPHRLHWRHNDHDGVSNHQPHGCLLNRLFGRRSKKSSASLAFVRGIHRDRWIPRTKGQLRGKCFHLMTSSWSEVILGLYSLKGPSSYLKISWSFEAARSVFRLYNHSEIWPAPRQQRYRDAFESSKRYDNHNIYVIISLRGTARFGGKTFVRSVNIGREGFG